MAIQFNRYKGLKSKTSNDPLIGEESLINDLMSNNHSNLNGGWRPFQLAFLLGIIPDIADPESDLEILLILYGFQLAVEKLKLIWGFLLLPYFLEELIGMVMLELQLL